MRLALAAAFVLPSALFAAGGGDTTPPTPTETTQVCEDGTVWDADTQSCLAPKDARLDDPARLDAVRELAFAGRLEDAQRVLSALDDPASDLALTYLGFTESRLGNRAAGLAAYGAALARNPDNLLARSYLGQFHASEGDLVLARAELSEIRIRGGRNSWAEISLRLAIEGGSGASY